MSEHGPLGPTPADPLGRPRQPDVRQPASNRSGNAARWAQVGLLLLIAAILFCHFVVTIGIAAFGRGAPQYEYAIIAPGDFELANELNEAGKQGWEVIYARRALSGEGDDRESMYELILRREVRD